MDTRTDALHAEQQALLAALRRVLEPLARLCIARGVTIQAVEETTRQVFVASALEACGGSSNDRVASRISTITGLTRREVSRLCSDEAPSPAPARSLSGELLAHWTSNPAYTDAQGHPRLLPRLGPAPSFEALASSITRDVHPRTVLSELERLNLVKTDAAQDTVALLHEAFVPRADWPQMVGFLGDNVGDHLRAAVTNVLGAGNEHFEQALLADELSAQAIGQARERIAEQWRSLMTSLGPELQRLMDEDRAAGRPQDQALRVGLYSWTSPMDRAPRAGDPFLPPPTEQ